MFLFPGKGFVPHLEGATLGEENRLSNLNFPIVHDSIMTESELTASKK